MRRLTLAALSAALVLSACSDQRESPTEPVPPPSETFGTTCTVTRFPLVSALVQIKTVFTNPKLRLEASARAAAIALLWDTCHKNLAQKAALDFVKWMSRQTLPTTPAAKAAQTKLIVTILTGVGLLDLPPAATSGPDFGIGLYDPTKTTDQYFTTAGGTASAKIPPGAFSEFTVIVISRRPDDSDPLLFDGPQFPPFFDYNAINASGNHFFANDLLATIAFCQLPETGGLTYPEFEDIKIGHNKPTVPVEFELLDPEVVPADLAALLDCENLQPTVVIGSLSGLRSFAHATGRYLAPIARAVFLPTPLEAATVTMGYLGPISTKTGSFSPFGIVEFSGDELGFTTDPSTNNTSDGNYFKGVTLDVCGDGCYPEVEILNGETRVGAGTNVTVSLIQTAGSGGVLGGTLTQPVGSFESGGTIIPTTAEFDDLTISAPGTYKLMFTAPGAASITSAEFKVYTMAFTVQPSATAGATFLETQFLGQTVAGFDNPVVQVSIVDFANAVVTTANDQIEMAVTTGSLNGTTSVSANSGVANFTEITGTPFIQQGLTVGVEANETGVSLQASASYFGTNSVQATSTTFNVTDVVIP